MATLVFFHAHPDDEAIATGGTMALARAAGHDVVLVLATRGEHGEPVPGVLREGEALGERREAEARAAGALLGASHVEFLGYRDSGMMGEPTNDDPTCFWQADVEEAAARLAAILRAHRAELLTVYDPNGNYGHPDHIQVHRVGTRAAELVGLDRVLWATVNRDRFEQMMAERPDLAAEFDEEDLDVDHDPVRDDTPFGWPEAELTHAIDVSAHLDRKREAMRVHASQIGDDAFFLTLPDDVFAQAFGTEWYVLAGTTRNGGFATDLFERPS